MVFGEIFSVLLVLVLQSVSKYTSFWLAKANCPETQFLVPLPAFWFYDLKKLRKYKFSKFLNESRWYYEIAERENIPFG